MRRAKHGIAGFAVRLMLAAFARTYGAQRRGWLALILGFVCHHGIAQNDPLMATCNEPVKAPFCFGADPIGKGATGGDGKGRAASDRVAGSYRAGSDHRKDGAAVGW
jgi:hypothetical protein